jgi:hypothetical protein
MAKRLKTYDKFDRTSVNALVEHMVEVCAEFLESSDPEMIRRDVMQWAGVIAPKYSDPRVQNSYVEMISEALSLILPTSA